MMRLPMINHGAGPPPMAKSSGQDTTMPSPRRRKSTMRVTPYPATALVTVAKGQRWQIILATVTCFLACTIACNKGSLATPCQNPLGTVPVSSPLQPDLLLSQNTSGGILMKHNNLLNPVARGQTGFHAAGEKQHATNFWADSAGTTEQLSLPDSKWSDLSQISVLAFNLDGQGSLHNKLGAAKKDENGVDSKSLRLETSPTLDALSKITDFSSNSSHKWLQTPSKEGVLFSPHASNIAMDSTYPATVPGALSQAQSSLLDADFLQYDSLHSAPKASAQPLKISPDAASIAQLTPDSGLKQQAAVDSLTSETWSLYKMSPFVSLMVPSTSLKQKATRSSPTSVLPKFLASAPQTYRASKEPSYLMSLTRSPTMPASPAVVPMQNNLTMSTNFPESTSLEATNIGPAELITSRWPGSSPMSSGVAVHEAVEPVLLGTVPVTQPGSLTPFPSGETFLDPYPSVTMPNQEHSPSELSDVTKFTWSALPVSMSQSTSLLPAPVSMTRLPSAKPMVSTSASAPLYVGDLSHFTEHPSPGPLTVQDTLAGSTQGVETEKQLTATVLMAVTPPVRESVNWPMLPVHVSSTAQSHPPSGALASPLKVTPAGVVHASSAEVSSGFPSQSGIETDLPSALSGHRGTRAHTPSVPKPATAELGRPLVRTTSLSGLSDILSVHETPSSLVLEEASSEQTIVPGVPHSLVTSSNTLSDVAVGDMTWLTGGVTEGPPSVAAGVGLSLATHPIDHLTLDVKTASTSAGRILSVEGQLGHRLKEHTTEMACAGSDSISCPTGMAADLSTAVEQKSSPSLATAHAPANLTIVFPSQESMRGVSSKPDTPVAGISQALTHSTVLTSVKHIAGFLHEDTAAYSLSHMLPISKGPRTWSSTSVCCLERDSSVSGASTAANITNTTLYRELPKTVKFLDKEQTQPAAEIVAKMPPGSSEPPLKTSSDAPTTELLSSASSAKPQARPAHKHYSLRRPGMRRRLSTPADLVLSHSTTSLPSGTDIWPRPKVHTSPQNKTVPVLPSKTSSDTSAIMKTASVTHSTQILNRTGLALLAGSTPAGMEYTLMPRTAAGVSVASTTAPSEWKPTSATLGEHKVPSASTKAANFSGLASKSLVSAMAPAVGLISTSMAMSKATLVKNRTALLPSPPALSTTTLLTGINLTQSSGPKTPIFKPFTEAKSSVVTSLHSIPSIPPTTKTTVLLTSARTSTTPGLKRHPVPKPTKLMPWNKTTVARLLLPAMSTLSTRLLLISQHKSTAKADFSMLTRTMAARKKLTTAAVTAKQLATIKTGLISKPILPVSEVPTQSFSTRGKTGSASRPTSPSLQLPVHSIPLQFHLIRIAYTELLKNKSSLSYKKLAKEVTLTLNKMLSRYENFLKANILQFLNGSIIVESEALFQRDGPAPTNSDLIRTIVTEVERKMDTFFDWRVDIKSIQSNGFSLENLEPEKLLVSFTALRLGSIAAFGDVSSQGFLDQLNNVVVQSLGALYKVKNFSFVRLRDIKGDLEISGEAYIDTHAHADVSQVLQALRGLVNYSVDLTTLSVDDSRLSLEVFPISFLISNRTVNEKLLDHSSVEHQNLTRDLADVLMHALRKYQGLQQVVIRDLLTGSLICHGDVVFQHPAPASVDVLQTLVRSVGPGDMLAGSDFQVDPYSFTVADDQLEPPFVYPSFPAYAVAIIVMCGLIIIAIPIVALLYLHSGLFGWHDKAIIQGGRDHEAGTQTFELDNQGFRSTTEEDDGRHSYTPTEYTASV